MMSRTGKTAAWVAMMGALGVGSLCAAAPVGAQRPAAVSPGAVATARAFLDAFRRADRAAMIGLMSPRLRLADGRQPVAQMLGVQNTPRRIDILAAGSDRNAEGPFTGVGVLLVFAHGTANADLQVVGTPAGYRVDAVTHPLPAA